MSNPPLAGAARFALNTKRVLAYLRHNGPLRGIRQLFGVYRQLHELRLGDFKGCDERGNEFYEDRLEPNGNRQRFVVYANTRDYDTSDITPEWHGWLHRIYQETPIERLPVRHEWLQPKPRNRLSKLGFFPTDIAPPGYLPRIIHEEPALPLSEREKRRVWAEEAEKLLARLQQERLRGIEPAPVDLALLAGHTGEWWIRRHRYAGVDELYRPWRREARPLPWLVPVNVRRKPAVDSEWESWRWSGLSWAQFFRMRDKSVEQKLVELKQARDKPKSGAQ